MAKKPTKKPKKKLGRKRKWEPTPDILKKIKTLSASGMLQKDLMLYFGVSKDVWYDRIAECPEMDAAVQEGKIQGKAFVLSKWMQKIREGYFPAIKYYLDIFGGYDQVTKLSITDDTPRDPATTSLKITVTDPIEASKIYQKIMGE